MFALLDGSNNLIAIGEWSAPPEGLTEVQIPDDFVPQPQTAYTWNGAQLVGAPIAIPPIPAPAPRPDIPAMIIALTNSPSIDAATKQALINALQGQ